MAGALDASRNDEKFQEVLCKKWAFCYTDEE
jgi:hypothetical protein